MKHACVHKDFVHVHVWHPSCNEAHGWSLVKWMCVCACVHAQRVTKTLDRMLVSAVLNNSSHSPGMFRQIHMPHLISTLRAQQVLYSLNISFAFNETF